jgi:predicted phosphodiesterase
MTQAVLAEPDNRAVFTDSLHRILFLGDTHANTDQMYKALDVAAANDCSRIFQVGDFGYLEHEPFGVQFLEDIDRYARHVGVDIYFLDGNHDNLRLLLEKYSSNKDSEGFVMVRPRVRYAPRGHVWIWKGKTFMALGGAYSVDKDYRLAQEQHAADDAGEDVSLHRGTWWFPGEEMTDEDLNRYLTAAPHKIDILLTHDKPRGSNPEWNRKDIPGCWPNQDRIQAAVRATAPDILIHGHLHWRYENMLEHDRGVTRVIGLSSDPYSAMRHRESDAWTILDLTNGEH